MTTEATNEKRAEWAGEAIDKLQDRTNTDDEDALCDLLCDLMHWADRDGFDFDGELERARYHYNAELEEERSS